MLSCSKGSRGLFVPLRVIGIFTDTTISPSSRSRQCPDHYTIRAGRNLPDKEFRYLRTVIVTAAVYRGFNSMLLLRCHLLLTFRHRAGVRLYTAPCGFAQPCVFAKQLPGPILCASCRHEDPLSRSYGVSLPSSLTVNLSSASVSSTRPPVSVSGTGRYDLRRRARFFSGVCSITVVGRRTRLPYSRVSAPAFPPPGDAYLPSTRYSVSAHVLRYSVTAPARTNRVAEY